MKKGQKTNLYANTSIMINNPWYPNQKKWFEKPKHQNKHENNFMKTYLNEFDPNDLATSFSMEQFEKVQKDFREIKSNSSLRKVYDNYYDIISWWDQNKEVQIQIWFAKIWYQEKRPNSSLPRWFMEFLKNIYNELNDMNRFRDFLEVFVAYHKYFNPGAK